MKVNRLAYLSARRKKLEREKKKKEAAYRNIIKTLKKTATKYCEEKGHKLEPWKGDQVFMARTQCAKCKMAVGCLSRPYSNEEAISGEATLNKCSKL